MNITYFERLSSAWDRMAKALFKPFDLVKWLTVGFTAFLAGLTDWGNGGGSSNWNTGEHVNFDELLDLPRYAWEWLTDNPQWFALIIFGVVFLIALGIVLTWLSSRGKFMFLDNVIHERALVVKPWHEYKKEGNSLFFWRLIFGLISLILVIWFIGQAFIIASEIYYDRYFDSGTVFSLIGTGFLAFLLFVATAYIYLFLTDFIVPIMYRYRTTTGQAWYKFLSLFRKYWLYFLLYGLFILLLYIIVFIVVVLFGIFTCCLGFIFLIIPYIGSVLTLPISYTFRALSVEFLEQFGTDFTIFTVEGANESTAPQS